jgi:molybdenum cofactor biosynthesis enzyme MoaA
MDKDLRKIAKALKAQGFDVEITGKGHIIVTRDGDLIASDRRSIRNSLAPLKRAGFRWPPG